ncbi:hypothetical protein [Alloprevotella rava]|uniref:hypothetical protein n=1 Tax=Alloprevotella rava TaxID=671218 RepID=UPI0005905244|nr:hypothetical protein [Alloprevotella rava]
MVQPLTEAYLYFINMPQRANIQKVLSNETKNKNNCKKPKFSHFPFGDKKRKNIYLQQQVKGATEYLQAPQLRHIWLHRFDRDTHQ